MTELIGNGWRSMRGFVADLMGDSAYARYVARHRLQHPDHPPLDERTWWRQRSDADERRTGQGCC
ncbi:YbdD/YjiX family protein [Micropruina sonneratiae]|uniref:YbdD/YjiX family protein n=1 Tax=Micropruina sonneratiae TaxID=2986940 RepID=UPI0022277840|nr:YbdD/YjiX family protein [Micropruina sp. KQZ13P-5]MCW3159084.1 YbdD/YjiX family protein [Micropruina sp. KQZ13P-5]